LAIIALARKIIDSLLAIIDYNQVMAKAGFSKCPLDEKNIIRIILRQQNILVIHRLALEEYKESLRSNKLDGRISGEIGGNHPIYSARFKPIMHQKRVGPAKSFMSTINILLVDDHNIVRQGLRALLLAEGDMAVVAEAQTGREAVQLATQHRPEVVVMDLAMPLLNGWEATRQILRAVPSAKVVVLSTYGDDEHIRQAIAAGAAAYLLKQTAAADLVKAIREVKKGNAYFSPAIASRLRDETCNTLGDANDVKANSSVELTPREAEVLQLIAEGFANKQIAAELGLSVKTIEKHRQQLMHKLDIHGIAGLVRHAAAKGIIEMTGAGVPQI
jgi:DNA-binding NarL/FixJ family response regulator